MMEQEKRQGMEPPAPGPGPPPAAATEPSAPPKSQQQPRPAVSVQPAMPVPRPWPVAFTPMKPVAEMKSGTPTKRKKHCNCKNSHCLKLYCECFAASVYCDGCNCKHCGNTVENEKNRQEAINNTKQRNPNAFQPKIENVSSNISVRKDDAAAAPSLPKHNKGCHCKKSGCLKKYCECFQANILCSRNCKCMDCKNFEGSEELRAIIQGDNSCDRNNIQQAANVALNGAIGSSGYRFSPVRRKRPPEDHHGQRLSGEGSMMQIQFQEANYMDAPQVASSTGREGCIGNFQSKSRMVYRSPLANTIHLTDVDDLANHLVIVCRKAAEGFTKIADNQVETEVDWGINTNTVINFGENKKDFQRDATGQLDNVTNIDQQNAGDFESHCFITQEDSRPASPGTQALMCDEQDLTFGTDYRSSIPVALPDQDISELHTVQENAVLREFRNYLRRIITRGQVNAEGRSSSGTGMELDAQRHQGSSTIVPPVRTAEKPDAPDDLKNPGTSQSLAPNGVSTDQVHESK